LFVFWDLLFGISISQLTFSPSADFTIFTGFYPLFFNTIQSFDPFGGFQKLFIGECRRMMTLIGNNHAVIFNDSVNFI
jgi:hypothetical protein